MDVETGALTLAISAGQCTCCQSSQRIAPTRLARTFLVWAICALPITEFLGSVDAQPSLDESLVRYARSYLSEKAIVAVLVRIDGGVSAGDYLGYFRDLGGVSDLEPATSVYELEVKSQDPYKIAVIRTIKGALPATFSLPSDTYDAASLKLGEPALVFLEAQEGGFRYGLCDVFPVDGFPLELVRSANVDVLVDFIVDKGYYLCLRDHLK